MTSQAAEACVMNEFHLRYASRLRRMRKHQKVTLQKGRAFLKPISAAMVELSKRQQEIEASLRLFELENAGGKSEGVFDNSSTNYLLLYTTGLLNLQYKLEMQSHQFVAGILALEGFIDTLKVWSSEHSASIQSFVSKFVDKVDMEIRQYQSDADNLYVQCETIPTGISDGLVTPHVKEFRERLSYVRGSIMESWRNGT